MKNRKKKRNRNTKITMTQNFYCSSIKHNKRTYMITFTYKISISLFIMFTLIPINYNYNNYYYYSFLYRLAFTLSKTISHFLNA